MKQVVSNFLVFYSFFVFCFELTVLYYLWKFPRVEIGATSSKMI